MKQKRLSTKIAAIVTISLTVVFGLLMATVVLLSGKTTSTNIRNELTNLAHANGNQVQAILDSASNQAISIGIVNIQNKLVLIMDIQKLFTPSEIERLRQ